MKNYLSNRKIFLALLSGAVFILIAIILFLRFPNIEYFASQTKAEQANQVIEEKPRHLETPNPVRGIYMTSWVAGTHDWRASLVKLIDTTELNSIVIDVKDYTGVVSFGSSTSRIPDVKDFIEELHNKNIYVIARISVFQDALLTKARPDLAVKRGDGKTAWKDYKGISWLDPCSHEVWDYTVKISREAVNQGFDELNFDYIRFPSDGNMKDISYPACSAGLSKSDAMANFFSYLKNNLGDLKIPLSADVFGMTTTNTDDLNIGQLQEKIEPYFDYICPMVYPSHYPATYDGYKNPALYPYEIITHAMASSSERLIAASSTPNKLRPWLQDFDLGATYDATMVRKEKQAVYDSGLTSWLMWDAANNYTIDALDP